MGKVEQEPAVEVGYAQHSLHVKLGRGRRERLDGGDLLWEGADPLGVHFVTEEGHRGLGDDTLFEVYRQMVLLQAGEDLPGVVVLVVLNGEDTHQDIIYITTCCETSWHQCKTWRR